jgi:prolyl-tRNA editing enzyme YbaK/EbsC (Cys-tRNA(Pro) deacylase)
LIQTFSFVIIISKEDRKMDICTTTMAMTSKNLAMNDEQRVEDTAYEKMQGGVIAFGIAGALSCT